MSPDSLWSGDPIRVDPDEYPARRPFAREFVCVPCAGCGAVLHPLAETFLLQGATCPACGAAAPDRSSDPADSLRRLMERESRYAERLECA